MKLYKDFTSQEAIDAQYDPMQGRDPKGVLEQFVEKTRLTREAIRHRSDLRYGPTLTEYLDYYPASISDAPLHVFFHGGYWRSLSARHFGYVAQGLVEQNINVAIINYELCPKVTIGEIVRQCRASLAWLQTHADDLKFNPEAMTLSGHSAGGHLVAMMLATEWWDDYALPKNIIKGACAISGLYDLSPFPYSWLQPKLQLTGRDVRQYSPVFNPVEVNSPVILAVGSQESEEFHQQQAEYRRCLQQQHPTQTVQVLNVLGADHFSILDGFQQGEGELFQAVLKLAKCAMPRK
ncbi:MAG: alpha/beta hydrolase [Saccharospirillum sp.]|nr:alpha/beta hydrolase [Saccharospirillum sp.]